MRFLHSPDEGFALCRLHRVKISLLLAFWSLIGAGSAVAAPTTVQLSYECGSLKNHFGPFDYRAKNLPQTEHGDAKEMVEGAHFDYTVESLKGGRRGANAGQDIDYTLRAFPNHHRALKSMAELALKSPGRKPHGMRFTADCWFERATAYAPDDPVVWMINGYYLARKGESDRAMEALDKARSMNPGSASLHYNIGLGYHRLKEYEKSLEEAHLAYALGFPLEGLKNLLKKDGKWRDPS